MIMDGMTLGGLINLVEDLAGCLQLTLERGVKRVLLLMSSASDIPTVLAELFSKFRLVSLQIVWMLFIRR